MKLIIGLGNPGKQYERTRHNVGFAVLDALHEKLKKDRVSDWSISTKFNAAVAGCVINNEKIILAKPMTFMNESGQAARLIADYYKLNYRDLIVAHDDKDLLLGDIKVQTNRSDAGHNGVKSLITHFGTQDFTRVRVGVANENKNKMADTADFVLSRFGLLERKKVEKVVDEAVEKIIEIIS
jgi:PTH1 family peptidyl-tRNA hydrolase